MALALPAFVFLRDIGPVLLVVEKEGEIRAIDAIGDVVYRGIRLPEDVLHVVNVLPGASVFPFASVQRAISSVEMEPLRMANPVGQKLAPRGEAFGVLPEGVLSGFPQAAPTLLRHRAATPSEAVIVLSTAFALATVQTSIDRAERAFRCYGHAFVRASAPPPYDTVFECFRKAGTGLETIKTKAITGLGDYARTVRSALERGLRDRALRRHLATETDLPAGLSLAKLSFVLALLGQDCICLDARLLGRIFPQKRKRAQFDSATGKADSGPYKGRVRPASVDVYERVEDAFLARNPHYDPADPLGRARAQWMSWESVGGEGATHGVWLRIVTMAEHPALPVASERRRPNPTRHVRRRNPALPPKDLASELADYLNTDVDPYDFAYLINEWANKPNGDERMVEDLSEDEQREFAAWLRSSGVLDQEMREVPHDLPSYLYFTDAKPLGKGAWLLHFSRHGSTFSAFSRGATVERLGLSVHYKEPVDANCRKNLDDGSTLFERVYGFAFPLTWLEKRGRLAEARRKYSRGNEPRAILFRSDAAVEAHHVTDEEQQAIFPICSEYDVHVVQWEGSDVWLLRPGADDLVFDSLAALVAHLEGGEGVRENPSDPRASGRAWADRVYAEKLRSGDLPSLGAGYTDEHRAARAVQRIAESKLFVRSARGGHSRAPTSLPARDRAFWQSVLERAGELAIEGERLGVRDNPAGSDYPPFEYLALRRPVSTFTVPKDFIATRPSKDPARHPHGIVAYARPLRRAEVEQYELQPLDPLDPVNVKASFNAFLDRARREFSEHDHLRLSAVGGGFVTMTRSTRPGVEFQVTTWADESTPTGHLDVNDFDGAVRHVYGLAAKDERAAWTAGALPVDAAMRRRPNPADPAHWEGVGASLRPVDVDPTQLAMGRKVELEHTTDPAVAERIALDHLAEDPRYYSKLAKMERNPMAHDALYRLDDGTVTTFDDFALANREGLGADELRAIRALAPGQTYRGGGGAAAEWSITRLPDREPTRAEREAEDERLDRLATNVTDEDIYGDRYPEENPRSNPSKSHVVDVLVQVLVRSRGASPDDTYATILTHWIVLDENGASIAQGKLAWPDLETYEETLLEQLWATSSAQAENTIETSVRRWLVEHGWPANADAPEVARAKLGSVRIVGLHDYRMMKVRHAISAGLGTRLVAGDEREHLSDYWPVAGDDVFVVEEEDGGFSMLRRTRNDAGEVVDDELIDNYDPTPKGVARLLRDAKEIRSTARTGNAAARRTNPTGETMEENPRRRHAVPRAALRPHPMLANREAMNVDVPDKGYFAMVKHSQTYPDRIGALVYRDGKLVDWSVPNTDMPPPPDGGTETTLLWLQMNHPGAEVILENPRRPATHRVPANEEAVHELVLYADNEASIYPQKKAVISNLSRKVAKGTYDPALAWQAWLYWIDAAAVQYRKEFGSGGPIFTPADREQAAKEVATREESLIRSGEYADARANPAGDEIDRTPRYAPSRVMIAKVGRELPVTRYLIHAPGKHSGPIRPEMTALELVTDHGSRWYGFENAYINSELRVVVSGFSANDEVRRQWPVVPIDKRDDAERPNPAGSARANPWVHDPAKVEPWAFGEVHYETRERRLDPHDTEDMRYVATAYVHRDDGSRFDVTSAYASSADAALREARRQIAERERELAPLRPAARANPAGGTSGAKYRLSNGYAFKYEGSRTWQKAPNDEWDTVVVDEAEADAATYVGTRTVDGSKVAVFKLVVGEGVVYFAQLEHFARAAAHPARENPAGRRVSAEKAVSTMQFYLGAKQAGDVSPQLKAAIQREIESLARKTGRTYGDTWEHVEREALRLGAVRGPRENPVGEHVHVTDRDGKSVKVVRVGDELYFYGEHDKELARVPVADGASPAVLRTTKLSLKSANDLDDWLRRGATEAKTEGGRSRPSAATTKAKDGHCARILGADGAVVAESPVKDGPGAARDWLKGWLRKHLGKTDAKRAELIHRDNGREHVRYAWERARIKWHPVMVPKARR